MTRATGFLVSQTDTDQTIPYGGSVSLRATVKNVGPVKGWLTVEWTTCVEGEPSYYGGPSGWIVKAASAEIDSGDSKEIIVQVQAGDLPYVPVYVGPTVRESNQMTPDDSGHCINMMAEEAPSKAPPEEAAPGVPPERWSPGFLLRRFRRTTRATGTNQTQTAIKLRK